MFKDQFERKNGGFDRMIEEIEQNREADQWIFFQKNNRTADQTEDDCNCRKRGTRRDKRG